MLAETVQAAKVAVAEVALVAAAVPGARRGLVGGRTVPLEQVLGDETARVLGAHVTVDGVAIGVGVGAGVHLEMVGETGGGGEASLAKRAGNAAAPVAARVEMLSESVRALAKTIRS